MLTQELLDFEYREIQINIQDIFPKANLDVIKKQFLHLKKDNPHETIFLVSKELWNGYYEKVLSEFGFYDGNYAKFSGHCHQCTPILGLVLKALGFDVSYLECFRIREHFPETGIVEQVPPREEPDPEKLEEFCSIGRIPYCCLEVLIDGKPYYITGKHIKPKGDSAVALLTPIYYSNFIGVFRHQDDNAKSGIYLKTIVPKINPNNADFSKQVVWIKQTIKDPEPEYFATFLRIKF